MAERQYKMLFGGKVQFVYDSHDDYEKKIIWGKIFGKDKGMYVGKVINHWENIDNKNDFIITKHYPKKFYKVEKIKTSHGHIVFKIVNKSIRIDDLGRDVTGLAINKDWL